jgi:catechol 2,3-dioxygenase-like lactoylglutathione lyase family enzyme
MFSRPARQSPLPDLAGMLRDKQVYQTESRHISAAVGPLQGLLRVPPRGTLLIISLGVSGQSVSCPRRAWPAGREKLKPMRLDHVQLNVSDLLASTAFYQALLGPLGYELGPAGEGWQVLKGREDSLCLVQTDVEYLEPDFHRKRTGLNHLTFRIGTREAFQEYLQVLEQLRVPLLYGGPLNREEQIICYFEDPDRIKIGVVA